MSLLVYLAGSKEKLEALIFLGGRIVCSVTARSYILLLATEFSVDKKELFLEQSRVV